MKKLQIFEGLDLTVDEAQILALYWNVADDDKGVIDERGNMTTSDDVWKRPLSGKDFVTLKKALEDCTVDWIKVEENTITIDFSQLRYNPDWLLKMFRNRTLGVCDSDKGLKLFQKRETSGGVVWFEDAYWTLRGVTVDSLKLTQNEFVSLTPNTHNPDEAEWVKLYFAA